ncbi:NAD-dependent succinate-semialdehyde dehydrogenase [Hydrogenophaga sp.]|uniref:NAD-dependent succinate-semialdehyde dehydrogenase n=1 Tax=Hydrogenophaga sp. TaxID=1904254 RepID=UPI00271DEEAA|nr:NAD-dependent succinate-semialdehyde dehydrogenase [Hydrogenophaga sp.]MDO9439172.1 NAD-dependent succinate-semialdehyde dehydrogenase [Hydrogenophaga sp.]
MQSQMSRAQALAHYPPLGQLIAGQFESDGGADTLDVIDPATGLTLGRAPMATAAQIERSLAAAQAAFPAWRRTPAVERGRILKRVADTLRDRSHELAGLMVLEQGKCWSEALAEVEQAAGMWEWSAEEGRRAYGRVIPGRDANTRHMALLEPVGPVAAFHAWNGPLTNPSRKLAGALAAGCTIVLKAAEEVPNCVLAVGRIAVECGLPQGVVSILVGDPATISTALIASPVTRAVTFTGSVAVGKMLAQQAISLMKRPIMELGGHAPVLVFDDADVESVARSAAASKFRNAGQICASPTRFYVQRAIYTDFIDAMNEATQQIVVGCGFDAGTTMGPLIRERRILAMEGFVADARAQGARIVTGGSRLKREGYFFEPTLLADVGLSARVSNEEPFGPIASLTPFDTYEDAIALANRLPLGLASYVHTRNVHTANRAIDDLEAGNVIVNGWRATIPETPFGGVKESGLMSEGGTEGLRAFQNVKHASIS